MRWIDTLHKIVYNICVRARQDLARKKSEKKDFGPQQPGFRQEVKMNNTVSTEERKAQLKKFFEEMLEYAQYLYSKLSEKQKNEARKRSEDNRYELTFPKRVRGSFMNTYISFWPKGVDGETQDFLVMRVGSPEKTCKMLEIDAFLRWNYSFSGCSLEIPFDFRQVKGRIFLNGEMASENFEKCQKGMELLKSDLKVLFPEYDIIVRY